jgi:hypothetical protein
MQNVFFAGAQDLRIAAYAGANCVLIAITLSDHATENLAGFAIYRQPRGEAEKPLLNRLSFDAPVTRATTPAQRKWTPSNIAPIQKFRWVDIPPDGVGGETTYRVVAMYFTGNGVELREGAQASVVVDPKLDLHDKFTAAFTRGYISSQAYADRFHNAPIRPDGPKTPDFDTQPYKAQYEWLGAGARKALFDFIERCRQDKSAKIDVFAYDLDEPDIVAAICEFGREGRLRAVLDNAPLHQGDAPEVDAAKLIIEAAGADNVVQGHFGRYQHNKVFIERDASGAARRVLFGSMNFSVRGLYVQSNNVIVAEDEHTPAYFAEAFDNAFENGVSAAKFKSDPIAKAYNPISDHSDAELPKSRIALSPHSDADISLGPVSGRIHAAKSSVLFAVMEPTGGGDVLEALRAIAESPTVFSYGTVETAKGLAVQRGDGAMGDVADFAYLKSKVPYPFTQEFDPGPGRHIHDKFVVIDFNGDAPTIVTGSSNLAAGGEKANGDSLAFIEDRGLATVYAIEALKIFDHYSFRNKMRGATVANPLVLWRPGLADQPQPWWTPYYDEKNIKYRDRLLFAGVPAPTQIQSRKNADWSSIAPPPKPVPPSSVPEPAPEPQPVPQPAPEPRQAPVAVDPPAADSVSEPAASAPPKKVAVRKKPARKAAAKKAPAKKTRAKKAPAKKAAAKKATKKKTTAKKSATKKSATKKASLNKPARKSAARKSASKSAAKKARKSVARKAATKRARPVTKVGKKTSVRRPVKKTPAKKPARQTAAKKARSAPRKAAKKGSAKKGARKSTRRR